MRVVLIVQARTGSTRLPAKILKSILGKPMLALEIERLKSSKKVDVLVLATTTKPADDATAEIGKQSSIAVFRGSESDVLDRYYQAAREAKADVVVRVTGDCPFHNGEAVDRVVEHFEHSGADYCINPTDTPEGLDTEVFTFSALERAAREAVLPSEREHVTVYIRNHPELFTLAPAWKVGGKDCSGIHLSVDTSEDFIVAEKIFTQLGEGCSEQEILNLLERTPELREVNAGNTGFEWREKSTKQDEAWKVLQRLVLGTVELGMPYGLDQHIQKPTKEEAFALLDAAFKAGIHEFDTASAYGSAEEVLGEWIVSRPNERDVKIISKGGGMVELEKSLAHLGIQSLEGYLLHKPQDMQDEQILAGLQEAKQEGLVEYIGVSIYDESEALAALKNFDVVQVPYNALDRRLDSTDFFDETQIRKVSVYMRSPFLQGLLLLDPTQLSPRLAAARPYLEAFIAVAQHFNLSQLQASILFALHTHPEHKVVFGIKTLQQLQDIIGAAQTSLPSGFLDAIRALPVPPNEVVDPRLWKE